MLLEGSCHCRAVRFSLEARHSYPFNLCYCSICRKTAGGGGFAINLGGRFASLRVEGATHVRVYRARTCEGSCGSMLWCWDRRWPDLIHPFASAIDTEFPVPPERTHLMLGSKASWVVPRVDPGDQTFSEYPCESIAEWHESLALDG